jgi:hypothetical protein
MNVGGARNLIRIYLLIIGGVPVCTGIVVFAIAFTGYEFLASDPYAPRSDLLETWAFAVPALAVLLICLSAWRRVARSGASGPTAPLARLVPILLILGVAAGAFATRGIISGAVATRLELEKLLCGEVLGYAEGARDAHVFDPAALGPCLPAAHVCDKQRRSRDSEGGWHPDRDQRPEVICLRKAGRAAGWLK